MEATLFSMINAEIPVIVADDGVEPTSDLAILDDTMLRLVGGGHVIVLQF